MPESVIAPGDVIAGKYMVEATLGAGGMGYVLGARHVRLDERVAIKILHPSAAKDGETVARFSREARAASRMKGDHVVRVLDVGALDDGTPFIVMEHLDGNDLGQLVDQHGPLPLGAAVDYVLQACEALAEAHAVGIVHRDVKPSNLFLTQRIDGSPCVKVLDFGISKAMSPVDATQPDFGMTRTQSVLGSPQYMAPEQMRSSRRVDGRTDIWALGTVIYELLTGEAPFVAKTMPELFAMILTDATPSLRARRTDVPDELDSVVARCLEKEPDRRYPNVLELARALAPFGTMPSAPLIDRIGRVTRNAAASISSSSRSVESVAATSSSDVLALAKTTLRPAMAARRVTLIAALFAALAVVGGTLLVIALRQRAGVDGPPAFASAPPPADVASTTSATMTATAPATTAEPPPEPPAPPPSATASDAPRESLPVRRPPKPAPASGVRPSPSATTSGKKPPAAATPAATATSRYD